MGFIYAIRNLINNKIYIGSTTNTVTRFRDHKKTLRGNRHHNSHLQRSWNKYGEENFEFNMISCVKLEEMIEWEQAFCDAYRELVEVYNMGEFVDCPVRGMKLKPNSGSFKKGCTINVGRKHSMEWNENMRQSRKGKPWTQARIDAQSNRLNKIAKEKV